MSEPQDNVTHRLRAGKDSLRRARREASVEEKFEDLWRAQHIYVQIVGSQRRLEPWQHPWDIMGYRTYSVVIDDKIERRAVNVFSSSVGLVRPNQRWVD